MDMLEQMKELVEKLNIYSDSYYNHQISLVDDFTYDKMYRELEDLELKTETVFSNSPTINVGYEVKSELKKVKHSHAMLSLDKTKEINDLIKFAGEQPCLLSLKMDGLTVLLTYSQGELIRAETRGDGHEGEDITHNARFFENIPLTIPYQETLEIEGEVIITFDDFEKINKTMQSNVYKNPRNLASGSVRQLNNEIAKQRHLKFIAWKVPTSIITLNDDENDSVLHRLKYIELLGFNVVPFFTYINGSYDESHIEEMIQHLKNTAKKLSYPIDGLVMTYNTISYGKSLGETSHHPKHSIAFKFYDESSETLLKGVEWTMGKTGVLTPTAVFEPVEINGTTVERASVHNVSILTKLELLPGDRILVYKANEIIPQISENLSAIERHHNNNYQYITFPKFCPICGENLTIEQENKTQILVCTNPNCKGKLLGKLNHFVSKNAMNIDGLSEATLEKFIEEEWVTCFEDIYNLDVYEDVIGTLDGFGKRSVQKLLSSIEKSKDTTLDRFIYALCIPLIGRSVSKIISNYFNGNFEQFYKEGCLQYFEYEKLEGFGTEMSYNVRVYLNENVHMIRRLADYMNFIVPQKSTGNNFSGMTFVITGSLEVYKNRDELKSYIESLGGKVAGSVSNKTSYLINNDNLSTSSKNRKAIELNIPIITEKDFEKLVNNP